MSIRDIYELSSLISVEEKEVEELEKVQSFLFLSPFVPNPNYV